MTPAEEYGRELARRDIAEHEPDPELIERMVRVICAIQREQEAA